MKIQCGLCKKYFDIARLSSKDVMPDVGWCCWECLTADPMEIEDVNNLNNKKK